MSGPVFSEGQWVRCPDLQVVNLRDACAPAPDVFEVLGMPTDTRVTIAVWLTDKPLALTVPASWCILAGPPPAPPAEYVVTDGTTWIVDTDGYPTMTSYRAKARRFPLDQACAVLRLVVETQATAGYTPSLWTLEPAP